jgi:myo-inositol-1(or 4)-monophosphatase
MKLRLQPYLDFAVETVYLAGRLTLGYFQTGLQIEYKEDHSPITLADRQSEELIRRRIEDRYPKHEIIGEEYGVKESKGVSHRWFIDPIDGTKSFMRGVPNYAVLLGLEIEEEIRAGVAYFPAMDEMLYAAEGLGCWWNGRRARVSQVKHMDQAVVNFTDLNGFAKYGRQEAWDRIRKVTYYRAGWGDAYGYCLVATGRSEIMLDPIMSVWDSAPFPVILKEAGGFFGDWMGNPTIYGNEGLATNGELLAVTLGLIQGVT